MKAQSPWMLISWISQDPSISIPDEPAWAAAKAALPFIGG